MTLKDLMQEIELEGLQDNADMMGYESDVDMNTLDNKMFAEQLAKAVLKEPQKVLQRLPLEDLQLLQMMKDAKPGEGMKCHNTTQMISMCSLGLAWEEIFDEQKGLFIIFIPEDFKCAMRQHIDNVLNDFNVKFRLYVENFLIGSLNIYGLLKEQELKKILKECMNLTDDGSGVFNHIYPTSIALQQNEKISDDNKFYYTSPFVYDWQDIINERTKRPDLKKPKHFKSDIIKEAGEMPVPAIPSPYTDSMMDCLTKILGFTKDEAYFNMFMVWRITQESKNSPIGIIQHLIDESGKVNDINTLNQVMQVVMNYMNSVPHWDLYGYSPSDLQMKMGKMTAPPRVSLGPNARSMGFTEEKTQQIIDDLWEEMQHPNQSHNAFDTVMPFIAPPKVGRNDPCPCGSGKKYKNCCGRGN